MADKSITHQHLGKLIEARLKEMGMTKAEFARRSKMSRQNVGQIIEKEVLFTDQLWRLSEVLQVNLFQVLAEEYRDRTQVKTVEEEQRHWIEFCFRLDEKKIEYIFGLLRETIQESR